MDYLFFFTQILSFNGKESNIGIYHEDSTDKADNQKLD